MKAKKEKKKSFAAGLVDEIRHKKGVFAVYSTIRILVILIGVRQFFIGNYEGMFLCAMTLALLLVPMFVEKMFSVSLPSTLEIVVFVFIFAAEILGELNDYYVKIPIWDTMLHTTTGFLAAAVGLSLIDILNRNERIGLNMSPLFVALTSFCFSMTIGVLWEFFEFGADVLLMTDMQKDSVVTSISSVLLNPEPINKAIRYSGITETLVNGQSLGINGYLDIGLYDTMKDLIVNFIGAVSFSIVGFFYTKHSGQYGAKVIEGLKITKDRKRNAAAESVDSAEAVGTDSKGDEAAK